MDKNIEQKITKPENCVLTFGIPVTKKDFINDQSHPNKYFAKRFHNLWAKYNSQFVSYLNEVRHDLENSGATILYNLTLNHFAQLFSDSKFDVIILFSHWEETGVEFFDGFASVQSIMKVIPEEFSGIIDLSICHPVPLTNAIRRGKPNCVVKYTHNNAIPFLWLYFYRDLFRYLNKKDTTYMNAVAYIVNKYLKRAQ